MPDVIGDATAPQFTELLHEAPILYKEAKAGYKTTEFWVMIVSNLLIWVDALPVPDKIKGIITIASGGFYAIARGLAKSGTPHTEVAVPEA